MLTMLGIMLMTAAIMMMAQTIEDDGDDGDDCDDDDYNGDDNDVDENVEIFGNYAMLLIVMTLTMKTMA